MKSTQLSRQNKKIHHWVNNYGLSLNPTLTKKIYSYKKKKTPQIGSRKTWSRSSTRLMSNIRQIIKKPQVKSLWNNKKEVATKPNKHRKKRNGGVTRNNWLQSLKATLFLGHKRSLQSPDPTVAEARYRTEQTNQLQDFRSQKKNPTTTIFLHIFDTRSSLLHIYYQF